jgi:preprotein translocase subunit SecA
MRLTGKRRAPVTVNDYLARRDAQWMGPIYQASWASTVGWRQPKTARRPFFYDPEKESPREDEDKLRI